MAFSSDFKIKIKKKKKKKKRYRETERLGEKIQKQLTININVDIHRDGNYIRKLHRISRFFKTFSFLYSCTFMK